MSTQELPKASLYYYKNSVWSSARKCRAVDACDVDAMLTRLCSPPRPVGTLHMIALASPSHPTAYREEKGYGPDEVNLKEVDLCPCLASHPGLPLLTD